MDQPFHLHVIHSLGGGSQKWLTDYIQADRNHRNLILKSIGIRGIFGQKLALMENGPETAPRMAWKFNNPIQATSITHPEYRSALEQIIKRYDVQSIWISSFLGHSLDLLNTGLTTVVILHDYFPFCPAINPYFDKPCVACDLPRLQSCFTFNKHNKAFPLASPGGWAGLRKRYLHLLRQPNVALVAPSDSTRRQYRSLSPEFQDVVLTTIPHGYRLPAKSGARTTFLLRPPRDDRKKKVLLLGRMNFFKGQSLFDEIYRELSDRVIFYLVGCGKKGVTYQSRKGIGFLLEAYRLEDLSDILKTLVPDLGLLLSICPETFSYSLSELFLFGIPPLATKMGSFEDRISDGVNGFLAEPTKTAMVQKIMDVLNDDQLILRVKKNLAASSLKKPEEMVRDYDRTLAALDRKGVSPKTMETNLLLMEKEEKHRLLNESRWTDPVTKMMCRVKHRLRGGH